MLGSFKERECDTRLLRERENVRDARTLREREINR